MILVVGLAAAGATVGSCETYHVRRETIPTRAGSEHRSRITQAAIEAGKQLGFEIFPWCLEADRPPVLELYGSTPRTRGHWLHVGLCSPANESAVAGGCRLVVDGGFGDNPPQTTWLFLTHFPRSSVRADVEALCEAVLTAAREGG